MLQEFDGIFITLAYHKVNRTQSPLATHDKEYGLKSDLEKSLNKQTTTYIK